ncbi:transcription termination factor 1 isoform X1 [Apteryx rowi]|uniref:transcription termination factor 1 isoform X1 n=1 Tax=Apteryx rowi TaxID=308060 RepID=UPI000E1DAA9D|nr:transcription termination factor 1 isoform X1 [Apteryx rowi]XP_025918020.1 transcription termination factor 1 isoform X1 [Apteryx rowi]XP_025918021.1 transcription termination factor 1 isoform X1 [Apteryx rowi]
MTEKASADDFQVWDSLKKKKKKHKHNKKHESEEKESMQNAECSHASPILFEDQAVQSSENCKKKKKKKKKKNEGEQEQPLLDNFCAGLEDKISNETVLDGSPKKKKKKKRKRDDSADGPSDAICVEVHQDNIESYQENETDYVKKSAKKKRKEKSPEKDEVSELPTSETYGKNDSKRSKKKKKRKRSITQDTEEGTDVMVNQSFLSSPEQNTQEEEDTVLALPTENSSVTMSQQSHEDADYIASPASIEDPTEAPAKLSKPTEKADHSFRKTPKRIRKIKSSSIVMEESSSESEIMTPEPKTSNREEDQKNSFTENVASDELDDEDGPDSSMFSVMDLDTAKQELEEFIPHVRKMSDSSIRKMAGRDLTRFKHFKKQGIAIRFGRFSQKENDQIRKNVEEFLSLTGIENAEKLLFTSRYPEEKETINRLKAEFLFCGKIAEGIPRPWRLIYYRARKIFDPNNYKGRYTKDEKEKLKKYYAIHGNDWKKISEMMSRSNLSVAMKYSEIKSAINYGPWTKEETRKLMRAVEEVITKRSKLEDEKSSSSEKSRRNLSIDREKLYQKLPWTEIEAKVGTRYWRQCKQKWTSILTSKMTKGQQLYKGTKGLQAKINLIKRLYEMKVEDANEVNWEELSNAIGDVPRAYVQAKFYKLKVSCVPSWQKKTFPEIIDYLYDEKLPELEEKLQKRKKKHLSSDSSTASEQKKVFQLSEIFDSSEESDN